MSSSKEKILLSLLAGVAFGCSITPKQQWRALKTIGRIWREPDESGLGQNIRDLNRLKLIRKVREKNGSLGLCLTNKGKLKAIEYYFDNLKIENKNWDGKWRILVFDIPEKLRKGRDALRWKIKRLGFYELQKSVFVVPYECREEIDFVVEFFGLRKYVHYGVLESIDSEMLVKLKKAFAPK